MAYQPINYAGIAPIENTGMSQFSDMFSKAIKAGSMPQRRSQEMQAAELANAMNQVKLANAPQMAKATLEESIANARLKQQQAQQVESEMQGMQEMQRMLGISQPDAQPQMQPQQGQLMDVQESVSETGPAPGGAQETASESRDFVVKSAPNESPMLKQADNLWKTQPHMRGRMRKLGFEGKSQFSEHGRSGQVFQTTQLPSGAIEMKAYQVGRTPEAIERAKEFAKLDVGVAEQASSNVSEIDGLEGNFEMIGDMIKDPNFYDVTGPLNSKTGMQFFMNPEQRTIFGKTSTAIGDIVLQAAKNIKGAFTGRDQTLINSLKPNMSDFPEVFVGKYLAMRELGDLTRKRNSLIGKYIRQGMTAGDAKDKAKSETSFDQVRGRYEGLTSTKKESRRKASLDIRAQNIKNDQEAKSFLSNLTDDEFKQYEKRFSGGN